MRRTEKQRFKKLTAQELEEEFEREMSGEILGMVWVVRRIHDFARTCHYFHWTKMGNKIDETHRELVKMIPRNT